jgi:WD40 repeat protein/serine/threonine protein kinase
MNQTKACRPPSKIPPESVPTKSVRPQEDPRVVRALEEYLAALEGGSAPDRDEFLACHADIAAALAECLDGLEFIRTAAAHVRPSATVRPEAAAPCCADLHPASPLGDYRIVREVGRGGMGVVYEAEQLSLGRRVALKVLPLAAALQAKQLQRFHNEAHAAAHLHHQHIVPAYAVGCERGVHYYAMQFIDGQTLATLIGELRQRDGLEQPENRCSRLEDPDATTDAAAAAVGGAAAAGQALGAARVAPSSIRDPRSAAFFRAVAQLAVQAAEALEHAHDQGVVHRDIKPANLLVDVHGHLWVTDFGLARLKSDPGLTMTGDVVGTARYMSPEQARAQRVPVDHRTDIYSLGATLYELLTLEPAFNGRDRQELLRQVAAEEPRPPRRLNQAIPADLETVCLKAMAKEPERRYQTAGDLADDLRRFLAGQPILARPVGPLERLWRWGRRNPAPAAAGGLAVVAFAAVVALCVGSVFAIQLSQEQEQTKAALQEADQQRDRAEEQQGLAEQQRAEAEKQRARAEHQEKLVRHYLYAAHMTLAQRAWESNQVGLMLELLERHRPLRAEDPDLRGFEWHYLWRLGHAGLLTLKGHTGEVVRVVYSPDGKRLISESVDGTVKEWDAATGQEIRTLKAKGPEAGERVTFSPDRKRLASSRPYGSPPFGSPTVKVWDATTGQEIHTFQKPAVVTSDPTFSPDGKWLAWGHYDGTVTVADVTTGQEVRTLEAPVKGIMAHVAFSPDGKRLAFSEWNETGKVCDASTGQELFTLKGNFPTFSPDSKRLATSSRGGPVKVWDATTGQELLTFKGLTDQVWSVAFSPDGKRLASASLDGTVKVWDATTGQEILTPKGHTGKVRSVAFSPDGKQLASGSEDGMVRTWDATTGPEEVPTLKLKGKGNSGAFSPDGKRLASGNYDGTVRVWDARTEQEVLTLKGHTGSVESVVFSPDGKRLASASASIDKQGKPVSGDVKVWDATTGQELLTLKVHAGSVTFSPDGKRLASTTYDRTVKVWDATTGQEVHTLKHTSGVSGVAFGPDGKRLASTSTDGTVKVWDATTGQELLTFTGHTAYLSCVAFSPDGKRLASGGMDGTVRLWDPSTGQEVLTLQHGHSQVVWDMAFSPDGKRLASAGWTDKTVKVWDTTTGQELLTLKHTGMVSSVAFSPDGQRLASHELDSTMKIWDATPLPTAPGK